MKLLVVPPAGELESAARALASDAAEVVYDTRQKIARGVPFISEVPDAVATGRELARHGLESYPVDDADLEAMPAIKDTRRLKCTDDGLEVDGVSLPWRNIDAVIRTRLDRSVSTETEQKNVKMIFGTGSGVARTTSQERTKERETDWALIIGCRDPLMTIACAQTSLDYAGLGIPLASTAHQNFQRLTALLEERTPHALHDRRLEQIASKLPPTLHATSTARTNEGLGKVEVKTTVSDTRSAAMNVARLLILVQRVRSVTPV